MSLYVPTVWTDRAVSAPNTYTKSGETSSQVTLVPAPGTVTNPGTPFSATNMNKLEAGVAAALPFGTANSEVYNVFSLLNEIDTRGVYITRGLDGLVTKIEEKDGTTVIRTTTVTYTSGVVTSIVVVANGKTITYTIAYDTNMVYAQSVTKTVT